MSLFLAPFRHLFSSQQYLPDQRHRRGIGEHVRQDRGAYCEMATNALSLQVRGRGWDRLQDLKCRRLLTKWH